ncbi:Small subunit (SSU) processome component [Exophiala xenobiotica]|nr:Small subunit (SSU) processome component [Exophiala xenobiotica]KAK5351033.1 Small subunit (SSU) processome component [Exophiala xenobiotica]KAK5374013.1 Small subunit (SSU) processome component [Exophiala xenobiotica]KAK5374378.1 Small subunit (SSU) processome component [Exophiala xenobiotica]
MSRKSSSTAAAKNSSAGTAVSPISATSQKSSVLKSSFAPSQLQLRLFASVIQSFDSQQLRIHDTTTGRLRCQHETRPGSRVTCLDWGYYGQKQNKKRKRGQDKAEGAVVAYGTSTAEICMFSPAEGKVVGTLSGGHERAVTDFKFSPSTEYREGWSIGEDQKLIQWDLSKNQAIRTLNIPEAANVLATPSSNPFQILFASSTPLAYDFDAEGESHLSRFDSFKNTIHSLFRSGIKSGSEEEFFLASDSDRYINVYSLQNKKLVRTLVAGSGVITADVYDPSEDVAQRQRKQLLSVVTKDGTVELFWQPFAQAEQTNGDLKSSRKNLTRKAGASIRLMSPDSKSKHVPIFAASIQGHDVVVASADSGADFSFQKIRWQDEGNGQLLFGGQKDIVKVRSASTLNTATLNGVKDMGKSHVDESKTVVVTSGSQPVTIDLSSDESEDEVDDDDEEEEDEEQPSADAKAASNDVEQDLDEASEADSDEEMAEADAVDAASDEEMADPEAEPTFGELLASRHPTEISISSALPPDASTSLTIKSGNPVIPSGMSLGTVLTQALRTNDNNLLEACLHTLDITIVKNTIQRLDPGLAGALLSKLAERLASRPGRYGNLIAWVQWTCIAHGGAIAAQPDVTAKVRTLYQVLGQRVRSLDSLLLLKGKLDMLDAQLRYRKDVIAQQGASRGNRNEPGMIYIEGADGGDNWDSEDEDDDLDEGMDTIRPSKRTKKGRKALEDLISEDGESEDEDEDAMPLENGVAEESDEDEDEDEDDDALGINGVVDVEAEEVSGAEESDPDDVGGAVADESESEASSVEERSDEEEEDDEEDSEMDSFINDGEIEMASDEDDVHVEGDSDPEEVQVQVQVHAPPEPKLKSKSKSPKKKGGKR